jgi:hypothetical protein
MHIYIYIYIYIYVYIYIFSLLPLLLPKDAEEKQRELDKEEGEVFSPFPSLPHPLHPSPC